MCKLKLYIAISLDGKIARPDGSVDWLEAIPNPDKTDYGYADFLKTIDTTLMGYNTYKEVLGFGIPFPYPDKTNYVFTRNANRPEAEYVKFISVDVPSFIRELKSKKGKGIWLIGGGQLNTVLMNAGLVDEMMIFVMPVVIGEGIPLFGAGLKEMPLKLTNTERYSSGVVLLKYSR